MRRPPAPMTREWRCAAMGRIWSKKESKNGQKRATDCFSPKLAEQRRGRRRAESPAKDLSAGQTRVRTGQKLVKELHADPNADNKVYPRVKSG